MKTLFITILIVVILVTGYGVGLGSLILLSPRDRVLWDHEDFELWVKCVIVFLASICGLVVVLKMP